ncbi:MAG: hypothetical protein ACI8XX_002511 [Polaribacter sp.]|jgi:hypothetical protein
MIFLLFAILFSAITIFRSTLLLVNIGINQDSKLVVADYKRR